jgi:collagenase-like PrtC family protease
MSARLANAVVSVLDHLGDLVDGLETVTTSSPAVARTVKTHFPGVEVRASVNMRIGTVRGMQYVADLFDGYYVQREYNRDLAHLAELKRWADGAGRRLHLLANSGCLSFCSGQSFHDNLVAHEGEAGDARPIEGWTPLVCWNLLRDPANWPVVLQSTWVRPEDLHRYEGILDVVKLATRMHARPRAVVDAYASRRHRGNLLDLFEPGFAPAFAPHIVDNQRFPADWFDRTSRCDRRCHRCGYCASVLARTLVKIDEADVIGADAGPLAAACGVA